jgi:hypothetical protein
LVRDYYTALLPKTITRLNTTKAEELDSLLQAVEARIAAATPAVPTESEKVAAEIERHGAALAESKLVLAEFKALLPPPPPRRRL